MTCSYQGESAAQRGIRVAVDKRDNTSVVVEHASYKWCFPDILVSPEQHIGMLGERQLPTSNCCDYHSMFLLSKDVTSFHLVLSPALSAIWK